jgi:hypothetical protein
MAGTVQRAENSGREQEGSALQKSQPDATFWDQSRDQRLRIKNLPCFSLAEIRGRQLLENI